MSFVLVRMLHTISLVEKIAPKHGLVNSKEKRKMHQLYLRKYVMQIGTFGLFFCEPGSEWHQHLGQKFNIWVYGG